MVLKRGNLIEPTRPLQIGLQWHPAALSAALQKRITPMAEFCTNCGAPLSGPFCGRCGHRAQSAIAPHASRYSDTAARRGADCTASRSLASQQRNQLNRNQLLSPPRSTATRHATTSAATSATIYRAAAKIFRRRQSFAHRRRNCPGSRSLRVWRSALWRSLGQAQSIFYYWRIVWL